MGDIKFTKALVFIGLFTIAIVGYSVGFANDNGSVISIDPDESLSSLNSTVYSEVDSYYLNSSNSSDSFFKSTVSEDQETTVSGGEFKIGLGSLILMIGSIFGAVNKNIFGGSPAFSIIFTAALSLLIWIGVRYIWKTWKGGNPD